MYQNNTYQGEGNPLTAGIYSLLIPNSEEEIQQVSYFQLFQTFLTILSCKSHAVESQDTGFEKEQVKMQDVIPKSNYIMIAWIKSVILKIDFRIYLEVDV